MTLMPQAEQLTRVTDWHNCYDASWKGYITPESFSHPAKMARGLLERILDYAIERRWIAPGQLIGDPFGGIGSTGTIASYRGLRSVSVELEPRFVELARANWAKHKHRWQLLGVPQPVMLQGDSREFDKLVGEGLQMVCASPPYIEGLGHDAGHPRLDKAEDLRREETSSRRPAYGHHPGQLGAMKPGSVEVVISSPPFTQGYSGGGGINVKGYGADGSDKVGQRTYQGTGAERTAGNLETLPPGKLDLVATSPPYEASNQDYASNYKYVDLSKRKCGPNQSQKQTNYGNSDGQLGQTSGETYWSAVAEICAACYRAIKPGGHLILVTKNYVKARKIVPLTEDTIRLCDSLGFRCLEHIHALLTTETNHHDLFNGTTTTRKERKSFFRRLAEKNGSPPIDYESVLIFERP